MSAGSTGPAGSAADPTRVSTDLRPGNDNFEVHASVDFSRAKLHRVVTPATKTPQILQPRPQNTRNADCKIEVGSFPRTDLHGNPIHLLVDGGGRRSLRPGYLEGSERVPRSVADRLHATDRDQWRAGLSAHARVAQSRGDRRWRDFHRSCLVDQRRRLEPKAPGCPGGPPSFLPTEANVATTQGRRRLLSTRAALPPFGRVPTTRAARLRANQTT